MEPTLPEAAALALAGDRIAGGVGTHETALASPDGVGLGGRCVIPGFNGSHVHFLHWSLAQQFVRVDGNSTLEETASRVAGAVAEAPRERWVLGSGWRNGDWSPPVEPTKDDLDRISGETPVALIS